MFTEASDAAHGVNVGLFSGRRNSDEDYARYVSGFAAHIASFREQEHPVYLLFADPETDSPGAAWRKKIAEASKDVPPHTLFLFVGGSRLARGVVTAVSWIAPRAYETRIFEQWDDAVAYAREGRPVAAEVFARLLAEARAKADAARTDT